MKEVFDMNDSKFKVLLYSDGSHQAFSAAVYTVPGIRTIRQPSRGNISRKHLPNWSRRRADAIQKVKIIVRV